MKSGAIRKFIMDPWCSNPSMRKWLHAIARALGPGRWERLEVDGHLSRYEVGCRDGRAILRDTVSRVQWIVPDPFAFHSIFRRKR